MLCCLTGMSANWNILNPQIQTAFNERKLWPCAQKRCYFVCCPCYNPRCEHSTGETQAEGAGLLLGGRQRGKCSLQPDTSMHSGALIWCAEASREESTLTHGQNFIVINILIFIIFFFKLFVTKNDPSITHLDSCTHFIFKMRPSRLQDDVEPSIIRFNSLIIEWCNTRCQAKGSMNARFEFKQFIKGKSTHSLCVKTPGAPFPLLCV